MNNPTRVTFTLELEGVKLKGIGTVLPRETNQAPSIEQVLLELNKCYLEYADGSSYFAEYIALIPFREDCLLRKSPLGYIAFLTKGTYEVLPEQKTLLETRVDRARIANSFRIFDEVMIGVLEDLAFKNNLEILLAVPRTVGQDSKFPDTYIRVARSVRLLILDALIGHQTGNFGLAMTHLEKMRHEIKQNEYYLPYDDMLIHFALNVTSSLSAPWLDLKAAYDKQAEENAKLLQEIFGAQIVNFRIGTAAQFIDCVGTVQPREPDQEPEIERVLLDLDECRFVTARREVAEVVEGLFDFTPWVKAGQILKTDAGYIVPVLKGRLQVLE